MNFQLDQWYATPNEHDRGWDIHQKNPTHGGYLATALRKDIAEFIVKEHNQIQVLREALEAFVAMAPPDQGLPDEFACVPFQITNGHWRRARAALDATRAPEVQ